MKIATNPTPNHRRGFSTEDFRISALHVALRDARAVPLTDDMTWVDLDIDSVIHAIECSTPLGTQLLYHRLRSGVTHERDGGFQEALLTYSVASESRTKAEKAFGALATEDAYSLADLVYTEAFAFRLPTWIWPALTLTSLSSALLIPFSPLALLVFIFTVLVSLVVRTTQQPTIDAFMRPFRLLCRLIAVVPALDGEEQQESVSASGTALWRLATLSRIVSWLDFNRQETRRVLFDYLAILLSFDGTVYALANLELSFRRRALGDMLCSVARHDLATAVVKWRSTLPVWVAPETRTTTILFEDVIHPQLPLGSPCSVSLHSGKGLAITGANMTGKSTLLRTLGLNVVLGQAVHTALAKRASIPELCVRSDMLHRDSLEGSKSYFLAEVDRVLELVHDTRSGERFLFLIDEPLTGTNQLERLALSAATLPYLLKARNNIVMATHDKELVDLVSTTFEHMQLTRIWGTTAPATDSNPSGSTSRDRPALSLFAARGAPPFVVDEAHRILDRFKH